MIQKYCFLGLLFLACRLTAQSTVELEKIGIEQGLSQGFVSTMCQDREGFMWFGTNSGLNRYDGYEFTIFRHDPYNPHSLSNNEIVGIVDLGELLCVLTLGGIDFFDKTTRRFYHLEGPLSDIRLTSGKIFGDGKNNLWYLGKYVGNAALFHLRLSPGFAGSLRGGAVPDKLIQVSTVYTGQDILDVAPGDKGAMCWLLAPDNLFQIDANDAQHRVPLPAAFTSLLSDGQKGLFLLGKRQLAYYKHDEQTWRTSGIQFPETAALQSFDAQRQRLWIGYYRMMEFDVGQWPESFFSDHAESQFDIPAGVVSCLIDYNGIMWLGTNARGIVRYNPRTGVFKNYLPGSSIYSPPVVDSKGLVWLSQRLDANGLTVFNQRFNPANGHLSPFPFEDRIPGMKVSRSLTDSDGDVWTAGIEQQRLDRGVLIRYRPGDGATEVFYFPRTVKKEIAALAFWGGEGEDRFWIVLPGEMIRFDRATKQFQSFDFSSFCTDIFSINAVAVTPDGSKWIGLPRGLLRAAPAEGKGYSFTLLTNAPTQRNSLPDNGIRSLLTDPVDGGILWIGTAGGGLSRLDIRTGKFTHFNTQNGLPDNVVYGIVPDDEGHLWLSTNKGLTKFNPATRQFQYFYKSDGLQENEFNTYAAGKAPDGALLFGGVNGLTIFQPSDLNASKPPPAVRITGLKINGLSIDPRDSAALIRSDIQFLETLEFPFSNNNITLQFVALDLTQPDRNRFRFYLEGAEPEWAHEGFEHTAQYLNLPPGKYVFKVKGANSDGIWNETPVALHITILPPWYRSSLAYLIYALLFGGGIYSFYRFQLSRRLEHAENARLKELDQIKSRIYTNITHEFRTPLTIILGMADTLEKGGSNGESSKNATALIKRNGQNLLTLINQMLDLSKLETGKMSLHRTRGDIISFIKYLGESFHSFASTKGVHLHFLTEIPELEMAFDREKIQAILFNLLSNAIKFTPETGHVYVQISEKEAKQQRWLSIRVKDTGIGIAADQLPLIFDRFYQADDAATRKSEGTGIGLALVRELVKLMNGDIQVSSSPGEGATFNVLLPVAAPDASDPAEMEAPVAEIPAPGPLPFPPALSSDANDGPLVLLVEDNADVMDYLKACIGADYQFAVAHNGREGLEMALQLIPDLVLSDVMMPEMDGLEMCRRLKNDERSSHIPVVLLTARADIASRIEGLSRGADDYLAKPFDRGELLARMSNLILLRRQLHARYASLAPAPTSDPDLQMEDAFLQKIRAVVEAHLSDTDFEMPQLERALGMSRSQIFRKVRALTGRSPSLYMRSVRLHRAKELLQTTRMSVSEIAYEVGFATPAYFSTAFQEEFGAPPSAIR